MTLARKLFNSSPKAWLNAAARQIRTATFGRFQDRNVNRSPCQETGLAWTLDERYFARRNPLITALVERIQSGEKLEAVLRGVPAKKYDERVVEYPVLTHWLLEQRTGLDILDVGCVLNNKLVSKLLKKRCGKVWLCNVAVEPAIYLQNPVFYHVAELANAFPDGERFPLVTCFSTIEHIGFDNSQYGCTKQARYSTPTIDPLTDALQKLARLTAPGGELLVSFPFGVREALLHPATEMKSSQVFDLEALNAALVTLNNSDMTVTCEVFGIQTNGWSKVDPSTCNARYADGYPAAGAVAILRGRKH